MFGNNSNSDSISIEKKDDIKYLNDLKRVCHKLTGANTRVLDDTSVIPDQDYKDINAILSAARNIRLSYQYGNTISRKLFDNDSVIKTAKLTLELKNQNRGKDKILQIKAVESANDKVKHSVTTVNKTLNPLLEDIVTKAEECENKTVRKALGFQL